MHPGCRGDNSFLLCGVHALDRRFATLCFGAVNCFFGVGKQNRASRTGVTSSTHSAMTANCAAWPVWVMALAIVMFI